MNPLSPSLSSNSRPAAPAMPVPQIESTALLGPHQEISIRHAGETYRLRRTRQGKLILTK